MAYGKLVYMYRFPNMTAPDGSIRTFDNNPAVTIPCSIWATIYLCLTMAQPSSYPEGFD
jgi:hypothetical protein